MKVLLLVLFIALRLSAKTVYIIPSSECTDAQLFNKAERDGCALVFCKLKSALARLGYACKVFSEAIDHDPETYIISCDIPYSETQWYFLNSVPAERCIAILWEPPATKPWNYNRAFYTSYKTVFTLFHEAVAQPPCKPFFYPQPCLKQTGCSPFAERKLCSFISSNKWSNHPRHLYGARLATINAFEQLIPEQFDFFGIGWQATIHPCYKGPVHNKAEILSNYKFALCYENMPSLTYITEKIFDCMRAGCVPIYLGASKIASFIPPEAYIDRRQFTSEQDLLYFLVMMQEEKHNNYTQAARDFFSQRASKRFSIAQFLHTILSELLPDYDPNKALTSKQQHMLYER